jgi:hypothetical protein
MKQAKKNWLIFTPGSLQYCSQNYCTVVPEMTVFLFAEITAFLFPVYTDLPLPAWFGAAFDQNTMAVFNRQPDLKLITFLKMPTRHAE